MTVRDFRRELNKGVSVGGSIASLGVAVSLGVRESPYVVIDPHAPLAALCLVARFHQIACEPAVIAHALGIATTQTASLDDVLLAAKHIGLKAKRSNTTLDRLLQTPIPALAVLRDPDQPDAPVRIVVLAQVNP